MDQSIEKIVADLCTFEPELKAHQASLIKMVAEIKRVKPDVQFDTAFARELKAKIMSLPQAELSSHKLLMKRSLFVFSTAAVALSLLLVVTNLNNKSALHTSLGTVQVKRVASGAFGSLVAGSAGTVATDAAAPERTGTASAGVVQTLVAPASAPVAFGKGGGGGVVTNKMFAPYIMYKYVYKGDTLTLTDASLDVYKQQPIGLDTSAATALLNQFGFGGTSLSSFSDTNLTSFQLTQKGPKGYIVDVNVGQGTMSINQNWATWPQIKCDASGCDTPAPLKPSDVPADDTITEIVAAFLKAHSINLENYGAPAVDNNWRVSLDSSDPGVVPYVPDVVTVVYPRKVNGQEVFDIYGNKVGLSVSVDIRQKLVTGVWNITSYSYAASAYAAETDSKRVLEVAERGGLYGAVPYYDASVKVKDAELGTPVRVLTTIWQPDGMNSNEITVPALYFPVLTKPDKYSYLPKGIVVPLIKEVLNQGNNASGGVIRTMEKAVPTLLEAK